MYTMSSDKKPQTPLQSLATRGMGLSSLYRPFTSALTQPAGAKQAAPRVMCRFPAGSEVACTKSTPHRLAIDSGVAVLAGFTLAWFITPMDQAVMQKMSGTHTLMGSLKESAKTLVANPVKYARSPQYFYVMGTYIGTYQAKNYTDTMCIATNQSNEASAFWKFWLVTLANGGLSVFWKDPGLAKLFGKSTAKMPPATYGWWMARDMMHMMGAVVAPDYCEKKYGWTKDQWRMAQTSFPMMVQLITTPAHLLGLDYYNNRDAKFGERMARVGKTWMPSVGIRCIRMFAPWSLGLLINRDLRDYLLADTNV